MTIQVPELLSFDVRVATHERADHIARRGTVVRFDPRAGAAQRADVIVIGPNISIGYDGLQALSGTLIFPDRNSHHNQDVARLPDRNSR